MTDKKSSSKQTVFITIIYMPRDARSNGWMARLLRFTYHFLAASPQKATDPNGQEFTTEQHPSGFMSGSGQE